MPRDWAGEIALMMISCLFFADKGRSYPVKVSGVEVVPDPVVRGEPATFKISASTGNQSFRCEGAQRICLCVSTFGLGH
jgi:hypothetical protein